MTLMTDDPNGRVVKYMYLTYIWPALASGVNFHGRILLGFFNHSEKKVFTEC